MQGHFNGIFPRFIGEESVAGGLKCELTHDPTWVIDPIDGTTNFVHSNPHICTILAFMVEQVQDCTVTVQCTGFSFRFYYQINLAKQYMKFTKQNHNHFYLLLLLLLLLFTTLLCTNRLSLVHCTTLSCTRR